MLKGFIQLFTRKKEVLKEREEKKKYIQRKVNGVGNDLEKNDYTHIKIV